ncbi:CU044_2847 family protein [Spirillospora sp. NPDC048911]|uniref:CU044_2847 family protein n=1 Tax=Spirillospora sp. NPDC048911 TaxID=3364527 RepID=UPI003710CB02
MGQLVEPTRRREGEQTVERAATDRIRPVAEALVRRLKDLPDAPEEFGLQLSAKAGAFITNDPLRELRLTH